MNKKYSDDKFENEDSLKEKDSKEENKRKRLEDIKERELKENEANEENNIDNSASAFSEEVEIVFKEQSKLQKVRNAVSKGLIPPQNSSSKWADLRDRTIWTVFMLIGFIGIICIGNFYCALLILVVITLIFSELIDLSIYKERNQEIKNYYLWNWWFYCVCIFFFYIRVLYDKLGPMFLSFRLLAIIYKYHKLISFMLYMTGFLIFLHSLTKGKMRYQFRVFAFNHIILVIFGVSSSLMISNVFNGLVWFILPSSLVICNDICAYIVGRLIGRTQLISLSPKKTVEGFVGGLILTILCCYGVKFYNKAL